MEANYKFVQDNSRALQVACENMLEDQVSHPRLCEQGLMTDTETSDRSQRSDRLQVELL